MAHQLKLPFAESHAEGFISLCERTPNYGNFLVVKGNPVSDILLNFFDIPQEQTLALLECMQTKELVLPMGCPEFVDLDVFLRPQCESLQLLAWNFEHEFAFCVEEYEEHNKIAISLYY